MISRDILGRQEIEAIKVGCDVFKSLNSLSVDLQSKRLSSFGSPSVDGNGSRVATSELEETISVKRIPASKPVSDTIFVGERAGREYIGGFCFELGSVHDDIINDQIGINAVLWIKLIVQEDNANLVGRDNSGRHEIEAIKVRRDVFKSLNSLSVDLQSEGFSSFGSPSVDGNGSRGNRGSRGSRVANVSRELEKAISVKRIPSSKPVSDAIFVGERAGRKYVGGFCFELDPAHDDVVNDQV